MTLGNLLCHGDPKIGQLKQSLNTQVLPNGLKEVNSLKLVFLINQFGCSTEGQDKLNAKYIQGVNFVWNILLIYKP